MVEVGLGAVVAFEDVAFPTSGVMEPFGVGSLLEQCCYYKMVWIANTM